jgi:probable HAF family extracellular repeat protein
MCYNRDSRALEKACGEGSTEGGGAMKHTAQNRFKALTSACVMLMMATVAWSQTLTWLGTLHVGSGSYAYGVSADGNVVVGISYNAVLWQGGVMQVLGTLGGSRSYAYDVSADGSVVVGSAENTAGQSRAFRWTQVGGMLDIGTLGGSGSAAYGVSADGSVVVGSAENTAGQSRAFRWTQVGGMLDIGTLGGSGSVAYGVSADGSVVVGSAENTAGQSRAFRWTQVGGMLDIGTLGGSGSVAYGVSADGSVVVGSAENTAGQSRAFRWENGVMEDLNQTYASLLIPGSFFVAAYAISPDGRYIVGFGVNAAAGSRKEAFLLDTGPRCTSHSGDVDNNGCVDDADLLAVLIAFGNTGSNLGRVDVNCDGVVDDADLLTVLFNFGSGC